MKNRRDFLKLTGVSVAGLAVTAGCVSEPSSVKVEAVSLALEESTCAFQFEAETCLRIPDLVWNYDGRSREVVFMSQCISCMTIRGPRTASAFPVAVTPVLEALAACGIGVMQVPCPELKSVGLARMGLCNGMPTNPLPLIQKLAEEPANSLLDGQAGQLVQDILQLLFQGITVHGIILCERSAACGVEMVRVGSLPTEVEYRPGAFTHKLQVAMAQPERPELVNLPETQRLQLQQALQAVPLVPLDFYQGAHQNVVEWVEGLCS